MKTVTKFSLVFVYNTDTNKVLLCKRKENDERGYDFICSEHKPRECGIECAYRTLKGVTGMGEEDITLQRVFDFSHVLEQRRLQVFAGTVSNDEALLMEGGNLMWTDLDENLYSSYEFITKHCLSYILSALHYNPEIGLFEGSLNKQLISK